MRRMILLAAVGAIAALIASAIPSSAQYPSYPSYPTTSTSTSPPTTTSSGSTSKRTVKIVDFRFTPKKLTIKKGQRVTWQWRGMASHNVTFRSLHKHSRTQSSGPAYRLTFARTGTYHYLCTIHGFTGTIVVR